MTKLIQDFKSLKELHRYVRIATYSLITFFVFKLLSQLAFPIHMLIEFGIDLEPLRNRVTFGNISVILLLVMIFFVLRKQRQPEISDKNSFVVHSLLLIYLIHYLIQFQLVENVFTLYPLNFEEIPKNLQTYIPFNWNDLKYSYDYAFDDYAIEWALPEFICQLGATTSIAASVLCIFLYYRTKNLDLRIKANLKLLFGDLLSRKRVALLLVFLIPSSYVISENIRSDDYFWFRYEVEWTQEELKKFQADLILANELLFTEKDEARKAAANKVFPEIVEREKRVQEFNLSLFSSEQRELKISVREWIDLWKEALQQMAVKGFIDSETIFELNQKYIEVPKVAAEVAPTYARLSDLEYWKSDFVALVK